MSTVHGESSSEILAYDLGTSGLKAVRADPWGGILDREYEPYGIEMLPDGGVEQDPEDWWRALVVVTRRLVERCPRPEALRTLAIGAQWSGTVPVDRDGKPLHRALSWMDTRGAPEVERVTRGFPRIEGYGLLRLLKWLRLSGGVPTRSGKDPIAHILFLKAAHPDLHAAVHKYMEPKDWLNQRLTGRFAATFDSITLHWVTDNRNIEDIRYDEGLLRLVGLEREKFPDLVRAVDFLGPLRLEVAAELGLPPGARVVGGMPDLHAAAVGSGAVRDFEGHVCIGTSSWLFCHVPFKKTDLLHSFGSFPSPIPGRYLLLDEQECAGSCLTWLRDRLLFGDDELGGPRAPKDLWARMDRLVERTPPGSGGLFFAPWLVGERTPVEDPSLRGGFFNLSLSTDRGAIVRAVYEGVALNLKWLLGHVERFCGRPFERLNFIGGGARSDPWCQILADVLDRPIAQLADPLSANARGAAFLAAVANGTLAWEQIPERVEVRRVYTPRDELRALHDEMFREFMAIHRATRPICARLNRRRPALPSPREHP